FGEDDHGLRCATIPALGTFTRSCGPAGIAGAVAAGLGAATAVATFAGWRRCFGRAGGATVRGGYGWSWTRATGTTADVAMPVCAGAVVLRSAARCAT